MFFVINNLHGQANTVYLQPDTILTIHDTIERVHTPTDSLTMDSLTKKKRLSPDALQSSVKYISQDSIIINLKKKKILLYEDTKVYYDDIELDAAFMEFGFVNSELYASGIADSAGHIHGPPIFKQGSTEFCSQEIRYNFSTKKGKVTKVITAEGEGYIHGQYVKHVDDKTSYIRGGQYTTCNLEYPHFQIRFNKAKVIQDDKIITGPAYISFGNIPTPLVIPFGYFPIKKNRSSGIVIPTVGESLARGFVFENFGYYFGISDNFDLLLSGDITTRGSWAAKAKSNYVFRYKCNGVLEVAFAQNVQGERKTPSWKLSNDFRVYWTHNQDTKSHPTTRFNAHVNIISRFYNKYNQTIPDDFLSNQFSSSLSLSTNIKSIFFFEGALSYSQNTKTNDIGISLPTVNMYVRQFYPFRKKFKSGALKWYDNISMQWTSQMVNQLNTKDSLFTKPQTWNGIQTGIQHSIPLNIPIKVGKVINWNNNVTFTEKWYLQRNLQDLTTISQGETQTAQVNNYLKRGFYALHDLRLSTSLTTKVFFQYNFKKGGLKTIRHVISPDINFTYNPNLGGNMYGTYFDPSTGKNVEYNYYAGSMYGGVNSRMQAIARFTVNNNLEIKVKSKKDTITGTRKITIFDNVAISCGYDFAADSLRWKPLTISGRTSLFSFLDITFNLSFDPYIIDDKGRNLNQTEAKVNNRLMRFSGSNLNIGLNWRINQDFFKSKKRDEKAKETSQPEESVFPITNSGMPNIRPDFKNPWNVTVSYTFAYVTSDNFAYYQIVNFGEKKYNSNIIQAITLSADVNITRKWKIGVTTGYDIQNKNFTYTRIEIYRDLHCWEMRFEWVPFGNRMEWRFQINVKASVLQDLKFKTQRDFRDNYY